MSQGELCAEKKKRRKLYRKKHKLDVPLNHVCKCCGLFYDCLMREKCTAEISGCGHSTGWPHGITRNRH